MIYTKVVRRLMPFTALKLCNFKIILELVYFRCAPPNAVYGFQKNNILHVKIRNSCDFYCVFFIATNPPPNAPAQPHMDFDQQVNLFSVIVFTRNKPTEIRDAP